MISRVISFFRGQFKKKKYMKLPIQVGKCFGTQQKTVIHFRCNMFHSRKQIKNSAPKRLRPLVITLSRFDRPTKYWTSHSVN